jgi:hypothetical protein
LEAAIDFLISNTQSISDLGAYRLAMNLVDSIGVISHAAIPPTVVLKPAHSANSSHQPA